MEFQPPEMKPAFHETWHLVAWISMLIAILVSPALTTLAVSPYTRYLVMSKRTGPSDWHANQVLRETAPLDILFIGHSRMWSVIDHAALQQEMHKRGVQVNSATIAANWKGYDFAYTLLTDFFARRRARLIVINYPESQTDSHPAEKYVRRLDSSDPGLNIQRLVFAATNYGEMALVGFRLALASVVPPGPVDLKEYRSMALYPNDIGTTNGSFIKGIGYQENKTFPRMPFVPGVLSGDPPGAIVMGAGAPMPADVILTDKPLTPIESVYLPALKALCERNGAVLALLLQPPADAADRKTIEVSQAALALRIPIMAASLGRVFGDAPTERIREHYSEAIHFNLKGARQSAKAYAAALQALLEPTRGR